MYGAKGICKICVWCGILMPERAKKKQNIGFARSGHNLRCKKNQEKANVGILMKEYGFLISDLQ